MIIIGTFLLVISIAMVIVIAVVQINKSQFVTTISDDVDTTVVLEDESDYGLYVEGTGECVVVDVNGKSLSQRRPTGSVTINNQKLFSIFSTTEAGEYQISCTSSSQQGVKLGAANGGMMIAFAVVGTLAFSFLGFAGLVVLIIGIVWLTIRKVALERASRNQNHF